MIDVLKRITKDVSTVKQTVLARAKVATGGPWESFRFYETLLQAIVVMAKRF